ncbi:MAG: HPr family phosphocarrier protein [Verrucomicrobia bacterium]|nr:HPr family phosphocarrier protein [Verrucomicrobiota bacterium]
MRFADSGAPRIHLQRKRGARCASANGRSILGLMCLVVGYESRLTIVMNGKDAPEAMAAVQQLFETSFEAAYAPGNKLAVTLG